jgi:hypothetical protein
MVNPRLAMVVGYGAPAWLVKTANQFVDPGDDGLGAGQMFFPETNTEFDVVDQRKKSFTEFVYVSARSRAYEADFLLFFDLD